MAAGATVRAPGRADPTGGPTGSALVRLLARLTEVQAPESKQVFAERLSQWLGWADAISLFTALNRAAGAAPAGAAAAGPGPGAAAAVADAAQVRAQLAAAIAARPEAAADYTAFRRHYLGLQQQMDHTISPLRARLRTALAAASPALARLAEVDAVMEQALAPQERKLLSAVPALLEKRLSQLRQAAEPGWPDHFGHDMQAVLAAELDIRFQPVQGLLAALHERPSAPT